MTRKHRAEQELARTEAKNNYGKKKKVFLLVDVSRKYVFFVRFPILYTTPVCQTLIVIAGGELWK